MKPHKEPVLRPWRTDVSARPLRAWSDRQLAAAARSLAAVLAPWGSEWGFAAAPAPTVLCKPAEGDWVADAWHWLGGTGDGAAWRSSSGLEASQLAAALFGGTPQVTPLLAEIGAACRNDAIDRIRAALRLAGQEHEPQHSCAPDLRPWSGTVVACLPWGARLLLGAASVGALVEPSDAAGDGGPGLAVPAPRVPVDRALAGAGLKLQVTLEGCELAVGSLQDLQLGDVLRLRHRIETPAAVALADGVPLFSGFLARSRGRKAVELAPALA